MNARQAAEYRDELARHGIALRDASKAEIRRAEQVRVKRAYKRKPKPKSEPILWPVLPPKSEPLPVATPEEAELATRLLEHCAVGSVVNREAHALGVARLVIASGKLGRKGGT